MSDTWTIGELAEHAARALRAGAQPVNGRVRDVPGERLIRWYTTIGLVDPPLTRRGRIARYGRRHLLQLVAVKRMQAAGHSIAEIQTALAGATNATLASAAGLADVPSAGDGRAVPGSPPDGPRSAGPASVIATTTNVTSGGEANGAFDGQARAAGRPPGGRATGGGEPGRERFWAERPVRRAPAGSERPADAEAGHAGGGPAAGVVLADGVRIVWDGGRPPSEDDVQAVLAAAGPLLAVLVERRLL
ncbi:helix-turn-helix domain-containing protein [Nonomuraea sp. NPDC049758]|uniref:helix-turn-helix domain-containing protein n=1 Tax=Nonomuraea sp. NPDC049758 TaxID=3154360 RepID=UPI00343E0233